MPILEATMRDILEATEVPAANEVQCGWGAHHSLGAAQEAARGFLAAPQRMGAGDGVSDSLFAAAQMNPDEVYTAMLADLENLNDLMLNFSNAVIIQVAMDEEIAPLLNATAWAQEPIDEARRSFTRAP